MPIYLCLGDFLFCLVMCEETKWIDFRILFRSVSSTSSDPNWLKMTPTWRFRSSATTTLRPNIAIVRDSGATQTIVNNAIVNNGSRVPISRNIVKNMDQVQDHIARVNTICSHGSNEVISSIELNSFWIVLHPSYSSWRHEWQCCKAK